MIWKNGDGKTENPAGAAHAAVWAAAAVFLAVLLVLQNTGLVGLIGKNDSSQRTGGSLEGEGYTSAEEAVEAYVEGLKNLDVDAVLSTFAIESYVDHADSAGYAEYTGAFLPNSYSKVVDDDYERQLRIFGRQNSIVNTLYIQMACYTGFYNNGAPFLLEDHKEAAEFFEQYKDRAFSRALSKMELKAFLLPEELDEHYKDEQFQKNMDERKGFYGCEEYTCIAACVEIQGEEWLLIMDCGRYGDRWYNVTLQSQLGNLLGISHNTGGLVPYPGTDWMDE